MVEAGNVHGSDYQKSRLEGTGKVQWNRTMRNSEIPDVTTTNKSLRKKVVRANRGRNKNVTRATSVAPKSHLSKVNYGTIISNF